MDDTSYLSFSIFSFCRTRRPISDEIADLRIVAIWGITAHVGWATCVDGVLATKSHVLRHDIVEVAGEE